MQNNDKIAESIISASYPQSKLNDIERRTELAMEFLSIMADHYCEDEFEVGMAEAIAVFMATTSYLCVDFGIPESKMLEGMKRLRRQFITVRKRLGPRAYARDSFSELSLLSDSTQVTKKKSSKKKSK